MKYQGQGSFTNDGDTAFRAWITALHDALVGSGWVWLSANTGQLDFSAATRPGTNSTSVGARMYAKGDALQSVAPIFLKLEVGTGSTVTNFGYRATVGIQHNGATSITGALQVNTGWTSAVAAFYSGIKWSWGGSNAGCVWTSFYWSSANYGPLFALGVFRYADAAGAPSAEGMTVYFGGTSGGAGSHHAIRFGVNAAVLGSHSDPPCLIPFLHTDSRVGLDPQLYRHVSHSPIARKIPHIFSFVNNEISHGQAITTDVIDGTMRTYMPMHGRSMGNAAMGASTLHGVALVWEDG
jgi:hypothetical protein